jgi:hypothetical protein
MEKSNKFLLHVYSYYEIRDKGNNRVMAKAYPDKFKGEMTVKQS